MEQTNQKKIEIIENNDDTLNQQYNDIESLETKNLTLSFHPYYGVKSWLKFFVIMQLYVAPIIFLLTTTFAIIGIIMYNSDNLGFVIIELAVTFFLTYRGIIVAKELKFIKLKAVQHTITFILIVFAWNFIDTIIIFMINNSAVIGFKTLIKFIGIVIWYFYFIKSERVRVTYPDWNAENFKY